MKLNFNIYIVAFFLFCAFFSCKKNERVEENQEKAVMGSPENFIQQYQQWLDVNDFEKAEEYATKEEKLRLNDLKSLTQFRCLFFKGIQKKFFPFQVKFTFVISMMCFVCCLLFNLSIKQLFYLY